MAQLLKVCVGLAEDPSLDLSIHVGYFTTTCM